MTEIYLFRHAQTDFPKELIGGRSNQVTLTETGKAQAHKLGLWIADQNLQPDYIAVSPAVRTRHTAEIALESAALSQSTFIEDRLQELTKGDAEGQLRSVWHTEEVLSRMAEQGHDFKHQNGESNNDAALRLSGWIYEMVETRPNQVIFGFTHGIVTRCLLKEYLGWSFEEWDKSAIDNCSATALQFNGPELMDIAYNLNTQN